MLDTTIVSQEIKRCISEFPAGTEYTPLASKVGEFNEGTYLPKWRIKIPNEMHVFVRVEWSPVGSVLNISIDTLDATVIERYGCIKMLMEVLKLGVVLDIPSKECARILSSHMSYIESYMRLYLILER